MKIVKRIFSVLLSVMILFFGVSNSYFTPVKMDNVEAAGTVVLGYETMQAICYYFGSLVLGYSSVAEVPDLTEEQIEKVGHAYIKSLFTVNGVPDHVSDKLAMANQALFTLISNKQAYVFGSEALKEVAETEFQVIMGGNNGDEEPSPSPDNKKKLNIGKAIGCIGALSVFGVTVFEESLKFYIDKFNNNDEVFLDEYINSLGYFTDYTISNGLYKYSNPVYFKTEWTFSAGNKLIYEGNVGDFTSKYPYVFYAHTQYKGSSFGVQIKTLPYNGIDPLSSDNTYTYISNGWNRQRQYEKNGKLLYDSGICERKGPGDGIFSGAPSTYEFIFNSNVPFFANENDAIEAIKNGNFTNALNYGKSFKNADWLQDNWDGELFDPLTGLSYLNDLANMAKHQGLNAIGNDPSLDDMKQHLRDIIANLKPGYDPVTDPSVDPALDPICYPDTIPTPVIDPTADVVLQPKEDPTPTPSPDPKPSTNPQPTADPLPIPDSPPEAIEDIADYVPTLADSLTDMGDGLKKKFPFSIPWDIHYILSGLATTPKAPRFELPLKVERYGIDETIVVDMARFQVLSDLSRSIFSLLFAMVLINLTIKVIGSLKEE